MDLAQKNTAVIKEFDFSRLVIAFHSINLVLILTNFALNFIGRPELKYIYLIHALWVFLSVIVFPLEKILPEIITLFFLEGQGRVLWEYQAWARIIFDVIVFLAVTKVFIGNKKVYSKDIIPKAFMAIITCHFLWYLVQIFNINAGSIAGSIAGAKIYIFPILMFLGLTQTSLDINRKEFHYTIVFFTIILTLELLLNIFQMQEKQILLLKISHYYIKPMRNGVFTGMLFRPFATTHLPGALCVFIFLTPALLYLKPVNIWKIVFRHMIIILSIINLIICQVRSALIKYIMILILIHVGTLVYHRLSTRKLFPYIIVLILVSINLDGFLSKLPMLNDKNLEYAVARTASLGDTNKLQSSRISTDTLGAVLVEQLAMYPLGVGPAMTGAASSVNEEYIKNDPVLNQKALWTHDNLIVSLFMELGYGAMFYIILIGLIPVYFTQKLIMYYRNKEEEKFRVILVCTSTLIVILIGNWGANALTYNPESFIFWLFSALGFYTLANNKKLT